MEDELRDGGAYDASTVAEVSAGLVEGVDGLRSLGVFSSVQVVMDAVDGEPELTDVTVRVTERNAISAKAGTYVDGSGEGEVEGRITLRNALGGAEAVEAVASYGSAKSASSAIKVSKPRFWGTPLNASLAMSSGERRHARSSCEEITKQAEVSLATKGGAHRLKMTAALRDVLPNRSGENPFAYAASPEIVAAARPSTKCSVAYTGILHDSLDVDAAPSRGSKLTADVECAGFGGLGDVSFVKADMASSWYSTIAERVALGLTARVGVLCPSARTHRCSATAFFWGGLLRFAAFRIVARVLALLVQRLIFSAATLSGTHARAWRFPSPLREEDFWAPSALRGTSLPMRATLHRGVHRSTKYSRPPVRAPPLGAASFSPRPLAASRRTSRGSSLLPTATRRRDSSSALG